MSEFRMPSLGADMDAATLIQWLVKPGDAVKKGDVILVVETNKGAIEVEVFQSGVIEKLLVAEQTKVPVGTPLALIRGEAETQPITPAISTPVSPAVAAARPAPIRTPDNAVANAARQYASPAARKQAARQQIRLAEIKGSGPSGAVVLKDVAQKPTASATEKAKPGFNADAMRQAIAAAMARSKREIPHYYLATQVDMSSAQTWLENYNAERPPEERLLLSVLLIKAVALALKDFPEMNGFYENGRFTASADIHPGFAISMRGGGLMTPAIHHADQLSVPDLMRKLQDLVQRVRRGMLRSSEMMDATVTLTALGERGVEQVFGVIYPPQVAIIGFGSINARPWAVDDALAIRPIMNMTLAADHRVSDGHRGALFLAAITHYLQQPDQL